MGKYIEFSHEKFGRMEVLLLPDEERMLFSHNFLRKSLNVKNTNMPYCSDIWSDEDRWIDLFEVFEYVKYARTDEETRHLFEEWIADVIKDCSKLL